MQAIRIDVLFVDDVPSCPLFFHPLFPSPKGLEPFCRFSWMLICRVAGVRFPNFLAYNIDIAVLSEACMELFLIVFKATMSVSMLNNPFCCRSTLAQSDSFQSPDFFNDGVCVASGNNRFCIFVLCIRMSRLSNATKNTFPSVR